MSVWRCDGAPHPVRATIGQSPGETRELCQTPDQALPPLSFRFWRNGSFVSAHNGGRRRRGGGGVALARGSRSREDCSLTILLHLCSLRAPPRRTLAPSHGDDRPHLRGRPARHSPDGSEHQLRPHPGHSEAGTPSAPNIPLPAAPPPSQCCATCRGQHGWRHIGIASSYSNSGARRIARRGGDRGGAGRACLSSRPRWQPSAPIAITTATASPGRCQRRSFEHSIAIAAPSRLGVLHHTGAACSRWYTSLSRGTSFHLPLSLCGSTAAVASSGWKRVASSVRRWQRSDASESAAGGAGCCSKAGGGSSRGSSFH